MQALYSQIRMFFYHDRTGRVEETEAAREAVGIKEAGNFLYFFRQENRLLRLYTLIFQTVESALAIIYLDSPM